MRKIETILSVFVALMTTAGGLRAATETISGFALGRAPDEVLAPASRELRPTRVLPRSWTLPGGWHRSTADRGGGAHVEILLAPGGERWARVYTWPIRRKGATAVDARFHLQQALGSSWILAGSRSRDREVMVTLAGWKDGAGPPAPPDEVALGRCGLVGERLVAVVTAAPGQDRGAEAELRRWLQEFAFRRDPQTLVEDSLGLARSPSSSRISSDSRAW